VRNKFARTNWAFAEVVSLLWIVLFCGRCGAADFTVSTVGCAFSWTISGVGSNPTITLVRGRTYTFDINNAACPTHPFEILSTGVLNNDTEFGTITWTVPLVASNYHYICSIHGFGGTIVTLAPPPPIKILNMAVSTNLTLTSSGTNTWSVNPEYKTNLTSTNWFALTVQTNRFNKGTNETICGKPPGTNIFIRIRSHPN